MEPNNRDKGITFENKCHSDNLDKAYLILEHMYLKESIEEILTGSPITDRKFTPFNRESSFETY